MSFLHKWRMMRWRRRYRHNVAQNLTEEIASAQAGWGKLVRMSKRYFPEEDQRKKALAWGRVLYEELILLYHHADEIVKNEDGEKAQKMLDGELEEFDENVEAITEKIISYREKKQRNLQDYWRKEVLRFMEREIVEIEEILHIATDEWEKKQPPEED